MMRCGLGLLIGFTLVSTSFCSQCLRWSDETVTASFTEVCTEEYGCSGVSGKLDLTQNAPDEKGLITGGFNKTAGGSFSNKDYKRYYLQISRDGECKSNIADIEEFQPNGRRYYLGKDNFNFPGEIYDVEYRDELEPPLTLYPGTGSIVGRAIYLQGTPKKDGPVAAIACAVISHSSGRKAN